MPFDPITFFPELQTKQQKIKRQQQLAMALQQEAMKQGGNEVVGGMVVKKSPLEALAKAGTQYLSNKKVEDLDKEEAALAQQAQQTLFGSPQQLAQGLSNAPTTLPATPAQSMEPGGGMQIPPGEDGYFTSLEEKNGLPRGLLAAVMKQESGGDPNAVSPAGAQGQFQFMPETAKQYGIDPFNPQQAADGAARMLGDLNKKYSGDLAKTLAAYNWGQGNVDRKGLENAPPETQNYIKTIGGQFGNIQPTPQQLAQGLQPTPEQKMGTPDQNGGIMGAMFQKAGVSPQEGMIRLMMGDQSVLKGKEQLNPNERYKVVGGQLVDIGAEGGPKAVFKPSGANYTDPVTGEVTENRKLSSTEQKELFDTMDLTSSGQAAKSALERAQALMNSPNAPLTGGGAETLAAMERVPLIDKLNFITKEQGAATTEFGNLIKEQALNSLKATFGGNPTEGERQILLSLQALPEYTKEEQKKIIDNAMKAADKRISFNQSKAKSIETGNYSGLVKDLSQPNGSPTPNQANAQQSKNINGKNYIQVDGQWYEQ